MNEEVFDTRFYFQTFLFRRIFIVQRFDLPAFENYLENVLRLRIHIRRYYEEEMANRDRLTISPYMQRVVSVCEAIAEEIIRSPAMKDFARSFMALRPPIFFAGGGLYQVYSTKLWVMDGRYDLFQNLVDFWDKAAWKKCIISYIDFYIASNNTTDILDILLANGYEPRPQALYYAVAYNSIDIVHRLIQNGIKATPICLNYGSPYFSPIQEAVRNKNASMLHILFLHGAKIEDDPEILTKTLDAADEETLAALLCYVENVNVCNQSSNHCLFVAISNRLDLPFLQMLVKAGADINYVHITEDATRRTPLAYAISLRNEIAEVYLRSVEAVL